MAVLNLYAYNVGKLAMRYALKIKANPNNPVYDSIFNFPYSGLCEDTSFKSLGESMHILYNEAEIDEDMIVKSKIPDTPAWGSEPNEVCFKLSVYDKSSTSPDFFKSKFLSDILPDYNDYFHIYGWF